MGIKNLNKNLLMCDKIVKFNSIKSATKDLFVDFSKLFYNYIYNIDKKIHTIEKFSSIIINVIKQYLIKYKVVLYIDKGSIKQKQRIRIHRFNSLKSQIINNINDIIKLFYGLKEEDKITLIDKVKNIIKIFNTKYSEELEFDLSIEKEFNILEEEYNSLLLKLKCIIFQIECLIQKEKTIDTILENIKTTFKPTENDTKVDIKYCYNVDAEYIIVKDVINFYNKHSIVPHIISDDQDVCYLLLTNFNKNFVINDNYYINDVLSKNIAYLTYIINESDYNKGINKLGFTITNKIKDRISLIFNQKYSNMYELLYKYISEFKRIHTNMHNQTEIEKLTNFLTNIRNYTKIDLTLDIPLFYTLDIIDINLDLNTTYNLLKIVLKKEL